MAAVASHASPPVAVSSTADEWRTKHVILIRHGRSTWNEFLGAHKKAQWEEQERKRQEDQQQAGQQKKSEASKSRFGIRGALQKAMTLGEASSSFSTASGTTGGYGTSSGSGTSSASPNSDLLDLVGGSSPEAETQKQSGPSSFWQGVRGGLKHVGNAINHAGKLKEVDHPLSAGGVSQVRQLRSSIAALIQDGAQGAGASLVDCRCWYVSPFLRALQTASYALAPLYRRNPNLKMRVTPQANEIVNNVMSLDCQGKKGNIGVKVVARALGKVCESFEDDDDDPASQATRQEELCDVSAVLSAMDITEIGQTWWTDVSSYKKENLVHEDSRVKRLVQRLLLENNEPVVGLVAHSLLFKRMLQLFWPTDLTVQEELKAALRNGEGGTIDPYHDKVMNCGTLVLQFRYRSKGADIIKADFLFDGRMESALSREKQSLEAAEDVADDTLPVGNSQELL
eukprot:TRINITY_DN14788_c0_g1_i1.p1 TRINITY_DN14788_c0_g1~~TRINITY_DN14788_c0_g1_i1.p1  ORF type:complete len:509 (+),score=108.61 TRINITY_DN14788_c0_g1_i1:164-1528(+)